MTETKDFTKHLRNPHGMEEPYTGVNVPLFITGLLIVIGCLVLFAFRYNMGEYMYQQYGIESPWMKGPSSKEIIESHEVEKKVEIIETPTKTVMQVQVHLKDANPVRIDYNVYPVIEINDEIQMKDILRKYFGQFTTEQVYENLNEHVNALKALIKAVEGVNNVDVQG
jgi:hypothetical protein